MTFRELLRVINKDTIATVNGLVYLEEDNSYYMARTLLAKTRIGNWIFTQRMLDQRVKSIENSIEDGIPVLVINVIEWVTKL